MVIRSLVTAGISVALAGTAHAGALTTPALGNGTADRTNCRVLNAGPRDAKDVTIEIRNTNGLTTETSTTSTLFAGSTFSDTEFSPSSISYCVVSGRGISKGRSRVTHCLMDAGNTPIACVTAP